MRTATFYRWGEFLSQTVPTDVVPALCNLYRNNDWIVVSIRVCN